MKNRKSSSLPRLFGLTMVIITLITLVVSITIYYDVKKERIRDLDYTLSVLKRYYELSFEQWGNTLKGTGERMLSFKGKHSDSLRLDYAKSIDNNYEELMAIGLASPNGDIMTFSKSELGDSLPKLMDSENSRRSFLKAKGAGFLSIGEAYYFKNVRDWILPLRVPIRADNGELLAVNTTALTYTVLTNDLKSFGFDSTYNLLLVNEDFNTIQFYYPLPKIKYGELIGKNMDLFTEAYTSILDGVSYVETKNSYTQENSFVLHTNLKGLNHTLYVMMPTKLIWQGVKGYLLIVACIYVLLVILVAITFWYSIKKQNEYLNDLIESQANLSSLFESTSSIIGLFDKNLRLVEFNSAFETYARLTDEIELKKGMDVFSKMKNQEIAERFVKWHRKVLTGEKFSKTIEYPSNEGSLYFKLSYNPIYQEEKVVGTSMFVDNITELKNYQTKLEELVNQRTEELVEKNSELETTLDNLQAAQQRLIASEKMASLGVMAAGMGHEINNPLNFIKNGASALKTTLEDKGVETETFKPFVDIIDDGVNRASTIVTSLSHFSRQVKTMEEHCDINAIINNCLTLVNSRLKREVTIEKSLMDNCPIIKGNEGKIHQAILNFFNNAYQAMEENGIITIETRLNNEKLEVTIKDDGKGIKPEYIEKIADPFFTTKDPGEGTGLGLFIAYNIIEEHNGIVDVYSKVGEGTTFKLTFTLGN